MQCLRVENLNCLNSDSKWSSVWKSADDTIVLKTLKHYEVKNLRRRQVRGTYFDRLQLDSFSVGIIQGAYSHEALGCTPH